MQDLKTKRFIIFSVTLVFICLICIIIAIRSVSKNKSESTKTATLEQRMDSLRQDLRNLDIKNKELEVRRYELSLEKEQISKEYTMIKDKYTSFGKTIKTLERDVIGLQRIVYMNEEIGDESEKLNEDINERELQLKVLQNKNDKLVKELVNRTKEKLILEIAFKAQARRLGLSEGYDPELKEIVKRFVTGLQ